MVKGRANGVCDEDLQCGSWGGEEVEHTTSCALRESTVQEETGRAVQWL